MSSPKTFRCVLMGGESLLVQCGELLRSRGHRILAVVTAAEDIASWARGHDLSVLSPGAELATRLGDEPFDWFFSIANLRVIPDEVLAKPVRGAINFHDGPLPRYAGLNAPSWAILNGERTHGVSWHVIEGGIDEGDLLAQRIFELSAGETALTLNTRCYELGIETFGQLIDQLAASEEQRKPQDLSKRTYFARHQRPEGACTLDFGQPAHRVDALVRALDYGYGRYANPIGVPKVIVGGQALLLPEVEAGADSVAEGPGTVISADDEGLEVATATGSLRFPRLLDADGQTLKPEAAFRLGLEAGTSLTLDASLREKLGEIDHAMAHHEAFWTRRLATFEPAQLPRVDRGVEAKVAAKIERRPVAMAAKPHTLLAGLGAWLARVTGHARFDLGHRHAGLGAILGEASALYSSILPLRLDVDREAPFAALEEAASAELKKMAERGSYPRELMLRQPTLRRPHHEIVFDVTDDVERWSLPGGAVFGLATDGTRAVLAFDAARLPSAAVDDLVRQLEVLLQSAADDASVPVGRLAILTDEERERILEAWNATEAEFPSEICVHQLFEAQVDRTPEAMALKVRGASLTYRELDAKANRLAHHLIELGVGPDVPVGLCLERSLEMMVAALAIQKAGGAYLPLDPTYPADRLAFMLEDSGAPVVVSQSSLEGALPESRAKRVFVDRDADAIAARADARPAPALTSANLAYLIYTSGSTGRPKGVMVEHRQVANFFTGMDAVITHEPPGVWLAVTSLSFDISVLELFWTLARGFSVVVSTDEDRALVSGGGAAVSDYAQRKIDFSLFYFASDEGERAADKYRLLMEGARFADTHGFQAVWTPERHFHAFGGLYPNPSVASAAIAAITENVKIRAGSCVIPLHHPVRVAEEWSLVDNLSHGRVGISFAAGWQPNDFILRPESFEDAKGRMFEDIETVRRLWRGETLSFDGPRGPVEVRTLPRPVQDELPFWITAAGNPETFRQAGQLGAGILTHLLGQSLDEAEEKIRIYREAWKEAGHPGEGHVSLMLHTFVGDDEAKVKEIVRGPMKDYLRSSMMLIQQHAWSFPAFKQLAKEDRSFKDNFLNLSPEDTEALLDHSFERYYETSALFGTPESARAMVEDCRRIGVDELACLIDFGIDSETVLSHLPTLEKLRAAATAPVEPASEDDYSIAAQLVREKITHMQCTPSMARMLVMNDEARAALSGLSHLMIGGEAFPGSLAAELKDAAPEARLTNMYGPTETTIWSATEEAQPGEGTVSIGRPIANTQLYVLDPAMQPLPVGVPGELYIGGDGVTRGYFQREELTRERFVDDPFSKREGARLYRTGDEVRFMEDGRIDFLGRIDHQVKIRGYRIELGEIEALLDAHENVAEAVVIAREDNPGDKRLVGYVVPKTGAGFEPDVLRAHLKESLPDFMVPAHIVKLERFPLTPNKKIDRKALPRPELRGRVAVAATEREQVAPEGETEEKIAEIWRRILGLGEVSTRDNFFELGGHSLLAVQAHREIREAVGKDLTVTDIFRFPTIEGLAGHLDGGSEGPSEAVKRSADRAAARRQAMGGRRVVRRR